MKQITTSEKLIKIVCEILLILFNIFIGFVIIVFFAMVSNLLSNNPYPSGKTTIMIFISWINVGWTDILKYIIIPSFVLICIIWILYKILKLFSKIK